ncbi:MAG: Asp23/Gls24 family envelope stress response protein [Candidatus Bipolaricaulaceae bacterium]
MDAEQEVGREAQEKGPAERRRYSETAGERGKIYVSEGVLTALAEHAAFQVRNLEEVRGGRVGGVVGIFGGRNRGIDVVLGESDVEFTLHVVLHYGRPLHDVAREIQKKVVEEVEGMTNVKVANVDVYVQDIQFPSEAEETEPASEADQYEAFHT